MAQDGDVVEALFKGCGKAPAVQIWDVNDFNLEVLPKKLHGTFYAGDSYLVLHTYKQGDGTEKLLHNIHFWIGSESSQDEFGSVAVFAAQLDDYLGGSPVQYRQVQQLEDAEFRKLFPRLTYRLGGRHKSGFTHVEAEAKGTTRLYHIRAQAGSSVQVMEVPLTVDSLCQDDSYVLEVPEKDVVYLWQGSGANIKEKIRARDVVTNLRMDSHSGTMKMCVVDYEDTSSSDAIIFYDLLGCSSPASVTIREARESKSVAQEAEPAVPRLFKLSSDAPPVEVPGALSKSSLNSEGQFGVLSAGTAWVWTGSLADKAALAAGFGNGMALLEACGLSAKAPVRCVKDGWEPNAFAELFSDWS